MYEFEREEVVGKVTTRGVVAGGCIDLEAAGVGGGTRSKMDSGSAWVFLASSAAKSAVVGVLAKIHDSKIAAVVGVFSGSMTWVAAVGVVKGVGVLISSREVFH